MKVKKLSSKVMIDLQSSINVVVHIDAVFFCEVGKVIFVQIKCKGDLLCLKKEKL